MPLKLGKKPATYDRRDLKYATIRPQALTFPKLPLGWGHGTDFPNWKMLGNGPDDSNSIDTSWAAAQGCGDCAWAGPAHEEMQAAHEAGRPIPQFSGKTVVEQYAAYSGYDPVSGNNDNGSDVREVLRWRQQKGLKDDQGNVYKVGAYVSIEPGNAQHLQEASYLFESVGIGIQVPDSAMDQFNNGETWSVVPGATVEGGHYIPVVGHPWPNYWTVVTWGQRQVCTWQFLQTYCDEVWGYIDPERYNKVTGQTFEHYKDADLEKYISLLGS